MSEMIIPSVYQAISSVQADIAKIGISKDNHNRQQGYTFRGIDDIYNAISTTLARHGLVILPKVLSREVTERTTAKGTTLFYTVVNVEYTFVSSKDASQHIVNVYGEAMDSGDKSTNKAMSAAYKYACIQTFCIPTEGDNDADSLTHEVAATFINEAQVKAINDLLDKTASDVEPFLTWANVESIDKIKSVDFDTAKGGLEAKLKRMNNG